LELLYEQLSLYNPADDPDKQKLFEIWDIKSNAKKRKRQLVDKLFVDTSMVLQSAQLVTALTSVKKAKKKKMIVKVNKSYCCTLLFKHNPCFNFKIVLFDMAIQVNKMF